MQDVDIVVFNDKSWVRFTEYQKVKEECEQLQQKWLESEYEKSKLVSQNEKLRCCQNCDYFLLMLLENEVYQPYCCEQGDYLLTRKVCDKWKGGK